MKTLDRSESQEWLRAVGVASPDASNYLDPRENVRHLTDSAGERTVLARSVVRAFFNDRESLLLISQSGVFESWEIPILFEEFRSRHSFGGTIHERPGTLIGREEGGYLTSLLALSLYFAWDVLVVDQSATTLFFASHDDEYIVKPLKDWMAPEVREFLG